MIVITSWTDETADLWIFGSVNKFTFVWTLGGYHTSIYKEWDFGGRFLNQKDKCMVIVALGEKIAGVCFVFLVCT